MDYSLDDILECERTPRIYRKTRRDRMEELQNGTELHLTERQVKERLKLKDQPEDVRTISLPGSYHDKITHLDSSLLNFTRLVKLDLSRNALLSLGNCYTVEQRVTLRVKRVTVSVTMKQMDCHI